jgi:hypothetical protein
MNDTAKSLAQIEIQESKLRDQYVQKVSEKIDLFIVLYLHITYTNCLEISRLKFHNINCICNWFSE